MIVIRTSEQYINSRSDGGVFSYILNDGIYYRRNGSSRDMYWRWPEEFICAPFRFDVRYDGYPIVTITEEHPEVAEAPKRRRSYLDLLPLDMRRAVLQPMCRHVVLSRLLVPEDAVPYPGADADVVEALRGVQPCSLMEAIDRVTTGCQTGCRCREQHRNVIKAATLLNPDKPSRVSGREWRNRCRKY